MQKNHDWMTGHQAWQQFTQTHPELGYRDGAQQFYNFLRYHRAALVERDALRRAKNKIWIAHMGRFIDTAFELATGGNQHG